MRNILLCTAPLLLSLACDAATTAQVDAQVDSAAAVQSPAVMVDGEAAVAGGGEANVVVAADLEADAAVAADAKIEIAVDAFKLDRVTTLVQSGEIATAEALELAVNDPTAEINRIDIDADGTVDHVEVVEVRGDAKVDFQLKVIPSSRASITHAVNLATASVVAARATSEVSFSASFSAGVSFTGGAAFNASALAFVAPATFEASAVIVTQPLLAWAFVAERPVYTSIYIEEKSGKWIPPGHVKHGLWKLTGDKPGGGHGKGKFAAGVDIDADAHAHGKASGKVHGGSKHDDDHGPSASKAKKQEPKSSPAKSEPKGGGSKADNDKPKGNAPKANTGSSPKGKSSPAKANTGGGGGGKGKNK